MPEYQVTAFSAKVYTIVEADSEAEAINNAMYPPQGTRVDWDWEFTGDDFDAELVG